MQVIYQVGLLPASNHQQIPFAYKMFSRTDDKGWRQSTAFKKAFSMDVEVEFIGVWQVLHDSSTRLPFQNISMLQGHSNYFLKLINPEIPARIVT